MLGNHRYEIPLQQGISVDPQQYIPAIISAITTVVLFIDLLALFRVFDFFSSIEIVSAVLMVFALENVLNYYFSLYVAEQHAGIAWAGV